MTIPVHVNQTKGGVCQLVPYTGDHWSWGTVAKLSAQDGVSVAMQILLCQLVGEHPEGKETD